MRVARLYSFSFLFLSFLLLVSAATQSARPPTLIFPFYSFLFLFLGGRASGSIPQKGKKHAASILIMEARRSLSPSLFTTTTVLWEVSLRQIRIWSGGASFLSFFFHST